MEYQKRIEDFLKNIQSKSTKSLGYPLNPKMRDNGILCEFLQYTLNNIGDPFKESNYQLNSFEFEREVIAFFQNVFNAPKESYGYVTSGGSEGNLYGIANGLKRLPNAKVVYSKDAHYSVRKACELLRVKHGNNNIEIINEKDGVILVATYGTTFTGELEDYQEQLKYLNDNNIPHYIHCDMALYGSFCPFLPEGLKPPFIPSFQDIDSLSISGHKFFAVGLPCGVVLTKEPMSGRLVEYTGCHDNTLLGSRSGFAALFFWYRIQQFLERGLVKMAKKCVDKAELAIKLIPNSYRTGKWSNTVIFPKPSNKLCKEWQLATQGNEAHIICMTKTLNCSMRNFAKEYNNETAIKR